MKETATYNSKTNTTSLTVSDSSASVTLTLDGQLQQLNLDALQ